MAIWRVNNSTALGGEVCAQWATGHAYALGARVVCRLAYGTTARRAFVYECTTAGTSHATTEPTWPTSGTVNDNDVVWTCRSPNDGDWNNASCFLHYVCNHAAPAAGDIFYVHNAHNENTYNSYYYPVGSTAFNNPIKYICVDKTDDSLSTGAVVGGTSSIVFYGFLYSYGITWKSANGGIDGGGNSAWCHIFDGGGGIVFDVPDYYLLASGTASGYPCTVFIRNGNIKLGQYSSIYVTTKASFIWEGGALVAPAGVSKTFRSGNYGKQCIVRDVDLSAAGANGLLNFEYVEEIALFLFERCRLHASTTLGAGAIEASSRGNVRMHGCSSANVTYNFREQGNGGYSIPETTIVRSGGASHGTTPISIKMVSTANVVEQYAIPFKSPTIHGWTDSTTEKTFTIEGIYDSATNLQNDEVFIELEYPANNTDGLGAMASDQCILLAAPADKTSSDVTWTTTGLTNPNKFKLAVTITPGKAGPITARVCLAKASTTIYIDPMIVES